MTKDEALTMIIASIAMEELALSHIVNAEGEKIQYILGTLPGRQKPCASTQEILAVNKSVNELLNTVMQNQMLLKGKLEKALEACGQTPQPMPEPPGPCVPPGSCAPSGPCVPPGPCAPSGPKSVLQLTSRCGGFYWDTGHLLSWRCQAHRGCGIRWDEKTPALVGLDPKKAYALDYTINVRGPYPKDNEGAVLVRLTPCDAFSGVLPLYFSVKCLERKPLTLHYATMLLPRSCPESCAELSLLLNDKGSLFVEQANLSVAEI